MSTGPRTTPARIALFNYGAVLLLAASAGLSLTIGDPDDLLGVKVLVAPLGFLAFGGLNAMYRRPTVERRLTVRSLEYTLLHATLFCVCLGIVWWVPTEAFAEVLHVLAILGVFFVPWRLYELHRQIRETSRREP